VRRLEELDPEELDPVTSLSASCRAYPGALLLGLVLRGCLLPGLKRVLVFVLSPISPLKEISLKETTVELFDDDTIGAGLSLLEELSVTFRDSNHAD